MVHSPNTFKTIDWNYINYLYDIVKPRLLLSLMILKTDSVPKNHQANHHANSHLYCNVELILVPSVRMPKSDFLPDGCAHPYLIFVNFSTPPHY